MEKEQNIFISDWTNVLSVTFIHSMANALFLTIRQPVNLSARFHSSHTPQCSRLAVGLVVERLEWGRKKAPGLIIVLTPH